MKISPKKSQRGNKVSARTKIVVVLGQNASGKSALGVKLAKRFDGEIISADSRQVYKRLDIGSGKITKNEMEGIPHHMIDVVSPRKLFTAEEYRRRARRAVSNIAGLGHLPIVVGGTGFYIDALIYDTNLPNVPPQKAMRRKLEKFSTEELAERLRNLDPARAESIDIKNKRRLVRALEIVEYTGNRVPELSKKATAYDALKIGLINKDLDRRIEKRLDARLEDGMVEEVASLRAGGISWKRLYELGLEYRYVSLYLRGEISKNDMREKLLSEIRKYAKRQMTWFKRDKDIIWITRPEEAFPVVRDFLSREASPSSVRQGT